MDLAKNDNTAAGSGQVKSGHREAAKSSRKRFFKSEAEKSSRKRLAAAFSSQKRFFQGAAVFSMRSGKIKSEGESRVGSRNVESETVLAVLPQTAKNPAVPTGRCQASEQASN